MSTLYIRLPSKAAAEAAAHWIALPCPFALVSADGRIEQEDIQPLTQVSELSARAKRVVLLLAASDVSLLRIKVPPLPPAKLKAALPNLVEDQLITDPADCILVAGPASEGMRTIAVVQRAWLEILARTFSTWGARQIAALPAQLCLPWDSASLSAAVTVHETDIDVALRLAEHEGIGLPILPERPEAAPHEVIGALSALAPQGSLILYVPSEVRPAYQQAVTDAGEPATRITVAADSWSPWIEHAQRVPLDLMEGIRSAHSKQLDWKRWRWPLALSALLLLIHVVGLNIQWTRMKNEAAALRASMNQIYRTAYPNEGVILDPVAQMRQKIAAARRATGQPAPDDFLALIAAFGEAWSAAGRNRGAAASSVIIGIEYRERSLFIRLKPDAGISADQLKGALSQRNLSLLPAPSTNEATVWQIRSNR